MYAIKAVFDGINFKPTQPIPVTENYEVVITFIEPLKKEKENTKPAEEEKLPCSTAKGLWKGKVWMSDDFNEPLEEMKEYMSYALDVFSAKAPLVKGGCHEVTGGFRTTELIPPAATPLSPL
ncbi:MAG: DUF2281 domain-containing protein [Oscillospiraceae bacterium]|nr:DUF2281 domain-containing protein [Oscillospiraceae bacterium]